MKRVTILGSTGSIGTQALEIIRHNPDRFKVSGLTCGENVELLAMQIREFKPALVAVGNEDSGKRLESILSSLHDSLDSSEDEFVKPEILSGEEGISEVARMDTDIVLNSLMGMRGLIPTLSAIEKGYDIALANKETLVAGGDLVMKLAREKGVKILPVDSEHSAIFQCLQGNSGHIVNKLLLTASGGPFRGCSMEELKEVTPEMALKHPNWNMGRKITIDSATMMNKGLEVIEAMHLFNVDPSMIKVLVHPQSIIHSGVEFKDRAVLAQLGTPDMKVPISVALNYPDRLDLGNICEGLDFFGKAGTLTFEEPDIETFKCLKLALRAAAKRGTLPAVMNGANEVLVELFLDGEIGFTDIPDIIEKVMDEHETEMRDTEITLDNILKVDEWSRNRAIELAQIKTQIKKGGN